MDAVINSNHMMYMGWLVAKRTDIDIETEPDAPHDEKSECFGKKTQGSLNDEYLELCDDTQIFSYNKDVDVDKARKIGDRFLYGVRRSSPCATIQYIFFYQKKPNLRK